MSSPQRYGASASVVGGALAVFGGNADGGLHERTPYWLNGIVPLAAMICQSDMATAFIDEPGADTMHFFAHGHTFANNPLACAVGSAVLEEMVSQQLDLKSQRLGDMA